MQKTGNTIPRNFFRFHVQIVHFLGLPLFFMLFILVYRPEAIISFLGAGSVSTEFNLVILTSILLLVLTGTRLGFFFLRKKLKLSTVSYAGWCVGELFVFSCFSALYLCLISIGGTQRYDFFWALEHSLLYFFGVLVWPYLIAALYLAASTKVKEQEQETVSLDNLIRFKDDSQKLRIAVASSSLLYVEANENYVKIVYLDGDSVKNYQLRSSMKRLEDMLHRNGLQRCHRAYFVNPKHIKVLRKDAAGMLLADLDNPNCPSIPVSKTYHDALSALL